MLNFIQSLNSEYKWAKYLNRYQLSLTAAYPLNSCFSFFSSLQVDPLDTILLYDCFKVLIKINTHYFFLGGYLSECGLRVYLAPYYDSCPMGRILPRGSYIFLYCTATNHHSIWNGKMDGTAQRNLIFILHMCNAYLLGFAVGTH